MKKAQNGSAKTNANASKVVDIDQFMSSRPHAPDGPGAPPNDPESRSKDAQLVPKKQEPDWTSSDDDAPMELDAKQMKPVLKQRKLRKKIKKNKEKISDRIKSLEAELLAELEQEEQQTRQKIAKKYSDKSTRIAELGPRKKVILMGRASKKKRCVDKMRSFRAGVRSRTGYGKLDSLLLKK